MKRILFIPILFVALFYWVTPVSASGESKGVTPMLSLLLSADLFAHADNKIKYTPNVIALVEVKGKVLSQEKYTGEIGGQVVELQRISDTILGFYIPNLASGTHVLKGSVEGAQGSLMFSIESSISVANPVAYTKNFITDILTQIDSFIAGLAGDNATLITKLQSIRDELSSNQAQLGTLSAIDQQLLADLIYINFQEVQSATFKLATKDFSADCSGRFDQAGYNLAKLTALIATFAVTMPAASTLVGAIVPGIAGALALQTARTFIITDVPAVYDVCFTSVVKEVSAELNKSLPKATIAKILLDPFLFENNEVKLVEFNRQPNSFTEYLINKLLGLPLVSTYYTSEITEAVMPKIDDPADYYLYPSIAPLIYTIFGTPDAGHLTAKLIEDPTEEVDFDLKFKNIITQQEMFVRAKLQPSQRKCTYTSYTDKASATCTVTNSNGTTTEKIFNEKWYEHGDHEFNMTINDGLKNNTVRWFIEPDGKLTGYFTGYFQEIEGTYRCINIYHECDSASGEVSAVLDGGLSKDWGTSDEAILQTWVIGCTSDQKVANDDAAAAVLACNQYLRDNVIVSEISQYLHTGSCHEWWDHYDEQGNWVECQE